MTTLRNPASTPAHDTHVNLEDRLLAMIRLFHVEPKLRGQDAWAAMLAETGGSAVFDSSHTAMARCYAGGFQSAMIGRLDALIAIYRALPDLKPVDAWKRMCRRFDINVVVDYKMVGMAQRMVVDPSILARLTAPAAQVVLATPDILPGRVVQRSTARLTEALPPTATTATMAIAPTASAPVPALAALAPPKSRSKREAATLPLVVHASSAPVLATPDPVAPARRTRHSRLDAYRDWFGVVQDAAIAAATGMTKGGVTLYRKRMGVLVDGTLPDMPKPTLTTSRARPAHVRATMNPAPVAPVPAPVVATDVAETNRSFETLEPTVVNAVAPDPAETNRSLEAPEPALEPTAVIEAPAEPATPASALSMPAWMPSAVTMAVVELVAQLAAQGIRSFTLTPTSFAGKRERVVVEIDEWAATL